MDGIDTYNVATEDGSEFDFDFVDLAESEDVPRVLQQMMDDTDAESTSSIEATMSLSDTDADNVIMVPWHNDMGTAPALLPSSPERTDGTQPIQSEVVTACATTAVDTHDSAVPACVTTPGPVVDSSTVPSSSTAPNSARARKPKTTMLYPADERSTSLMLMAIKYVTSLPCCMTLCPLLC